MLILPSLHDCFACREHTIAAKRLHVYGYKSRELLRRQPLRRIFDAKGAGMSHKYFSIKSCEFAFKCPCAWERLAETGKLDERHCESCQKLVYLCVDDAALARHVIAGHCVAVSEATIEGAFHVGKMEAAYDPDPALRISH